jgi:hypothetical protein
MTVLGKGWAAAKPTVGSYYIALGRNARKTLLAAVTQQLGDMTVGESRIESTENTIPSGIFTATRIIGGTADFGRWISDAQWSDASQRS